MELKNLDIKELVELLNNELKEDSNISVNGICKKYGASNSTIKNKLRNNDYKYHENTRQYVKELGELELLKIENQELKNSIQKLIIENNELKNTLENFEEQSFQKLKNERGAGRKALTIGKGDNKRELTQNDIKKMKELREEGKSIKAISLLFNCSVGLVHKLINEQQ